MADNSVNDKQNDIQLSEDNNSEDITEDKQEVITTEDVKDNEDVKDTEDNSQDIKSSDLANPIPSPESESEKRCTSASNAGESEYESADDEEVKRMDSFEDTSADPPKESPNQSNDEICVQNTENSTETQQKISIETTEDNESDLEPNVDKTDANNDDNEINEEITSENKSEESENTSQNTIPQKEENLDNSCTENSEHLEEKSEEVPNDDKNEIIVQQTNDKIDETIETTNEKSIDLNENSNEVDVNEVDVNEVVVNEVDVNEEDVNQIDDLVNEEGGCEQIADIEDEYEDMDESEEDCSLNSGDNEEMAEKDNEDIDAEERQQGDGEESNDSQSNQKDKSLDHDEDKRNPQYIPKKGPFYEHDDRAMAAAEAELSETVVQQTEETPPTEVVISKQSIEPEAILKKPKKKVWVEGDKWGHDLFRPDEQTPKSKDELVNIYGYDIRNEDNPPLARRKRHYARGPIKYTRQWQDENAYGRGRTSPPPNEDVRPHRERKERRDKNDRNERPDQRINSNDRIPKDRIGSERSSIEPKHSRDDRKDFDKRDSFERKDFDKRESFERKDSYERKDRIDRKEKSDRRDKHRIHDKSDRNIRSDKSNEFTHKKERFRNDRPFNENRKFDYEESIDRRDKPFSTDDFPELPNNDLRKKLNSNSSSGPEGWKPSHRFVGESRDDQGNNEYKTEPMKIIEAIEHNNRATAHNDPNSPNVVRTLTFENSKYSQKKSSGNYDYEDERAGTGRTRPRKSAEAIENSGRPIRKANNNNNNNNNYQNFSHERKDSNESHRNNRNNIRTERNDRPFLSEESSNRNVERYYEDDYRNQRDRESNYIIEANTGLQKMTIEDKSQVINRTNDSEQTRPKRYSSLRQQQRVIPENMANIGSNTQLPQTSDNHNINAHQFYDSHTIQTTAFYAETSSPRPTYHTYIAPTATEAGPQSLPSNFMQQPIPQPLQQRYIPQPNAPTGAGDTARYIPTAVAPNVVTAPVPAPQMAQPLPQTGPVPPPPQPVISAPPPGTAYIPSVSFPSGYPQFPPAPPPTHVPPGYPGHVAAQQPSPHQLAELYRGGVTYYDTQSQQQNTVRHIPQRRPKAAIPIVPPPDPHSSEGDGDKSYVSVNS